MRVWMLRVAFLALFAACGGKVAGDALDGGIATNPPPADAGSPDVMTHPRPEDGSVTTPPDTGVTAPVCTHNGGGGSGGPGSCEILDEEVCDGVTYQIDCRCPEGTCTCSGSSGGLVKFVGCPSCPSTATAYSLCGYPH